MALLETKVFQINNSQEEIEGLNTVMESFGWNVLNIQITHSQNSRTYTRGFDYLTGNLTTETTTLNYATITYQRDKQMSNYGELVRLEQEFERLTEYVGALVSEIDQAKKEIKNKRVEKGQDISSASDLDSYLLTSVLKIGKVLLGIVFYPLGIYWVIRWIINKANGTARKNAEEAVARENELKALIEEKTEQIKELNELQLNCLRTARTWLY